ncbi:MAG: hypothetical protein A4S09_14170 [Proteobacteria bacterium SG_bin7]|nr:MAG: hypothetical protein A4S09_14170 [Proteobacteria bacterium SG_bin7]
MGVKKEIIKGISLETFNLEEVFTAYTEYRGLVKECGLAESFADNYDRLNFLYRNVFEKLKIPQTRHNSSIAEKYLGFQLQSPPSIDGILSEDLDPYPEESDSQNSEAFKGFLNAYMGKRKSLHFYDITAMLGGRVDWYYHQILVVLWLYNKWDFSKVKSHLSKRSNMEDAVKVVDKILFDLFGQGHFD